MPQWLGFCIGGNVDMPDIWAIAVTDTLRRSGEKKVDLPQQGLLLPLHHPQVQQLQQRHVVPEMNDEFNRNKHI
ncbi:hypothetical protein J6590_063139 [Homalodisca vitripennis]|nr:hypothetical protein J6590_063139 [Homalodisca vitripennis]